MYTTNEHVKVDLVAQMEAYFYNIRVDCRKRSITTLRNI